MLSLNRRRVLASPGFVEMASNGLSARNTLASLPGTDLLQPGVLRFHREKGLLP